jgi:hypothetical protein
MPEQVGDLVEQLRRLSWEVRISRDQLLKVAEGLPSSLVERAEQTAERLMGIHRKILETSGTLPVDPEIFVSESLSESVAGLRGDGVLALRELDVLINELHDFFAETPVSKTN